MGVLTVTIREELSLNGTQQGATNTLSIASVTQSFKRLEDDSAADASTTILLEAGKSFMLGKAVGVAAVDDDAATATAIGSLVDLESIIAINDENATAQLEVFIAS